MVGVSHSSCKRFSTVTSPCSRQERHRTDLVAHIATILPGSNSKTTKQLRRTGDSNWQVLRRQRRWVSSRDSQRKPSCQKRQPRSTISRSNIIIQENKLRYGKSKFVASN